jgi:hypothetical protein
MGITGFELIAPRQEPDRVKDALLRRVDDYEATARRVGADMCDGSLSMLLGNEVRLSAAAALAAALLHQPLVSVSAAVPIMLQIGKIALDVRRQRRNLVFDQAQNPVAFLHEVKRLSRNAG